MALQVVAPPLQQELQRSAPGIDLVIQPWHGADAARAALIDGSSDLAVSVFPPAEDDLHRQEVMVEHYVVAMRARHPAAKAFNLKTWLAYPHVLVSGRGDNRSPLDAELAPDHARFLAHCQDQSYRSVRIIHGKGNGSPNSGPVIKRYLDSWLRKRQDVVAFCSARPVDGGTGAVYVLLRAMNKGSP